MLQTRECRHCAAQVPDDAVFCHICGGDVASDESLDANGRLRERLAASLEGRYRVLDVLGAGGMGVVFLAEDLAKHRKVAIKVLLPELSADANVVERFEREARTAAALDHAGVVRIYEQASDRGLHYFVMQYVEGRTLEDMLLQEPRASVALATRVLYEASNALAGAHRRGVVHRDVKPANIMVDGKGQVLVTDFGISKVSGTAASDATTMLKLTGTGGVVGTPHYMAPEHALGQAVDGRTDQYALAVLGFQMLAGHVPFDDETAPAIINLHINSAAPPLASLRDDVPPHLAAAIARAMSKSPSHRFPTIEEFAEAVAGPPATRGPRWHFRLAAALVAAGLAGGSWWVWQKRLLAKDQATTVTLVGAPAKPRADTTAPTRAAPRAATPAKTQAAARAKTPPATRAKTPAATRTATAAVTPADTKGPVITLHITSMPAATLFIDGRRIGQTPIKGHKVSGGGDHSIRLERPGYRTLRETIRVTETQTVRRYYGLRRAER